MIVLLIITFLAIFLFTRYQQWQTKKTFLSNLRTDFYNSPDSQEVQWNDVCLLHKELMPQEEVLDDVTWNDLDMNLLFQRLNTTQSFLGEQVLYHQLRAIPLTTKQIEQTERQINTLIHQEETRVEIQYLLSQLKKDSKDYSLILYFNHPHALSSQLNMIIKILQILLVGSIVGLLLTQHFFFLILLVVVAGINLVLFLAYKTKLEVALHSLNRVKQCVALGKALSNISGYWNDQEKAELEKSMTKLAPLTKLIGSFQSLNLSLWAGELFGILRDYTVGITLWDFTTYGRINKILLECKKEVWDCVLAIGKADMMIAIASFRQSCPVTCSPIYTQEKRLEMKELIHPLLKQPVSNDLNLEKPCLITGSNASGKSTFIKAIAINAILGQQFNTCCAQSFIMPKMKVVSSMTVRDDVLGNDSYYVKELKYLKRILEQVDLQQVTLCLMDEILRGTNAEERLAISKAFLSTLAEKNCLMIVATHDTTLIEQLKTKFQCFYFKNEVEHEKLIFDYKIHSGISPQTNAIQLLHQLGFPDSLITLAKQEVN